MDVELAVLSFELDVGAGIPVVQRRERRALICVALTHHGAVPGTTRLLQKPFTAETLIEKVREALNG